MRADLGDREVEAHLADPGRLTELLVPGAALRLEAHSAPASRRTGHTVRLVRAGARGPWVSVDTSLANRLAGPLLAAGAVNGIPRPARLEREVRRGASRFDFRLIAPDREPMWVEVKSVTWAADGIARFPDAPTERGRRHVAELIDAASEGERAGLLFVVGRKDVRQVRPYSAIDPEFARLLCLAKEAGVVLRAVRFGLDLRGTATCLGPVPVRLDPVR